MLICRVGQGREANAGPPILVQSLVGRRGLSAACPTLLLAPGAPGLRRLGLLGAEGPKLRKSRHGVSGHKEEFPPVERRGGGERRDAENESQTQNRRRSSKSAPPIG